MTYLTEQPNVIAVIIPVYNALSETKQCISALLNSNNLKYLKIVVIEDASTDPEVIPYLKRLDNAHDNIHCIYHEHNRGFVATVNEGIKLNLNLDVILLNSDTLVYNNWADRLCNAAYSLGNVATVTPFSNNASICSFPKQNIFNNTPLRKGEYIDRIFSIINASSTIEIPTGVGFCMYIRREIIRIIGDFSEAHFGKGYGEENDFCFRAKKKHWLNLLAADTFVYHHGGCSFNKEKEYRIQQAMQTLHRLHPNYHNAIHQFIDQDPVAPLRLSVALALQANNPRPVVLILRHSRGGGTQKHIDQLKRFYSNQIDFLELYPLANHCVALHLSHSDSTLKFYFPSDFQCLIDLCKLLKIDYIHIHHVLGLPIELLELPHLLQVNYDITLHDYYFISGNINLSDDEGRYIGVHQHSHSHSKNSLSPQSCELPSKLSLRQWNQEITNLFRQAKRIISPSYQTSSIYQEHFMGVKLTTVPHRYFESTPPYPPPRKKSSNPKTFNIVVIGAISKEKGADLLESTAIYYQQYLNQRQSLTNEQRLTKDQFELPQFRFYLLGYAYRELDSAITVTGKYNDEALPNELRKLDPSLIWFPALWPETYCYTLSCSLALGLPILAPNIGSFPERLKGRPLSWIYDWNISSSQVMSIIKYIDCTLQGTSKIKAVSPMPVTWVHHTQDSTFYRRQYLNGIPTRAKQNTSYLHLNRTRFHQFSGFHFDPPAAHWSASALKMLRYLSGSSFAYPLTKIIPRPWQRRIRSGLEKAGV